MQLKQSQSSTALKYTSVGQAFQIILRDEGAAGLYKGLGGKMIQSVLTAAILFLAKEILTNWTRTGLMSLLALVGRRRSLAAH